MTEQEKLEKVINKVTAIVSDMQEEVDEWKDYSDSELRNGLTCDCDWWYKTLQTLKDALALLKEQEPRVMTLEEVKAFEWDYCYLEQERQPGKEYRMIAGDYALTCITWPCITSMRIEYGDSSYGVKWRCWTSEPTKAQREATPWN